MNYVGIFWRMLVFHGKCLYVLVFGEVRCCLVKNGVFRLPRSQVAPEGKKTTQGSVNARAFIKTVIPTFTLMHTHTSPFFFSGPGQGAPSQYSQYQQGQSQQYSSYRSTQSTPGSQTQRSYTYEQVEHAHSTYSHTNRVCNT